MINAIDLFCGAGGTTTGVEASGRVRVVAAINHWSLAVETHKANHPETRHVCASIDHVDPKDFLDLKIDLILASPECVFHSRARGGKPVDDQRRATAWCVPRWAEVLRPRWIVIENVREFVDWGPLGADNRPLKSKRGEIFRAWVAALESLNYRVEWRILNSADFGAATKRLRLFVIARRGNQKIPWPEATHADPRKRGESLFGQLQPWRPAADCIDWQKPCPSIFARKRSLAEKTLRRIEIGIRKFCEPFIVRLRRNSTVASIDRPLDTITAGGKHHALAVPFLVGAGGSSYAGKPRPVDQPFNTIKCDNHAGLVTPFIVHLAGPNAKEPGAGDSQSCAEPFKTLLTREDRGICVPYLIDVHHGSGDGRSSSAAGPLPTITTKPGNAVVMPFLIPTYNERPGQAMRSHSVTEPLPTVVANWSAPHLVVPFLTKYFGTGGVESVDAPLSTVTTKPRHGLALVEVMRELGIIDIGFRMLDDDELALAQGFPAGYKLAGNKSERVKQIGNSVHTAVARAIAEAIAA